MDVSVIQNILHYLQKEVSSTCITILLPFLEDRDEIHRKMFDDLKKLSETDCTNTKKAIKAINTALKLLSSYDQTPLNGICIFCCDNFSITFEPSKPLHRTLYYSGRIFWTNLYH
jgi:peptide subunit release factor 1 (eRF1)